MAYGTVATSQQELVDQLMDRGIVRSPEVEAVLRSLDRACFAPDARRAYADAPQPIGHAATISAPHMHAYALELLAGQLMPGARVLDVGSGTGYLTAAFAQLVSRGGAPGKVVGVEHIPELTRQALASIAADQALAQLLRDGHLELVVGDGRLGWPAGAPYDAIHVGAAAPRLPQALVEQLAVGGRMVVPLGPRGGVQALAVVDRGPDGGVRRRDAMSVQYVPLTAKDSQLAAASDGE